MLVGPLSPMIIRVSLNILYQWSGSPFGGSFNFCYNASETTYLFSLGGLPGLEMDQEIGGTDYTVDSSAWMGAFIIQAIVRLRERSGFRLRGRPWHRFD